MTVAGIRRVSGADGPLLRAVYLRMYADSPDAFSETLAEARALTAEQWAGRAEQFADVAAAVAFVAIERHTAAGFIAGYVGQFRDGGMDWDARDTVTLAKAWVDPSFRRRGVGRALANAVMSWASDRHVKRLEVQATENNAAGVAFYRKLGFQDMGLREPLRSNPALRIHFLSQRSERR